MSEYTIKLDQFEGPLDLLLKLIDKSKLDISDVSLARVTEQYIEYIQRLSPCSGSLAWRENEFNPDELADFLVIATRLLLIKSKGLLPKLELDEEYSTGELERQLKMYKAFLDASREIEKMFVKKNLSFSREKLPRNLQGIFTPPKNMDGDVLSLIFKNIIEGLELTPELKQEGMKRVISIKEKIDQISGLILQKAELRFDELVSQAKDRVEMIVSFLAILELVKQRKAVVSQSGTFSEIRVVRAD